MERRPPLWDTHESISPDELSRTQAGLAHLKLSPLLVQLLANRELIDPAEIENFLNPPDVSNYPDSMLMAGMKPAVERICCALKTGEKVVVYGDFDADGVTSTALLTTALRHFGANVEPYIPNRVREGYGLNSATVKEIAAKGTKLLITVDCGISGRAEVEDARAAGMDVIVTDHHHLPSDLPDACACINPKLHVPGCECFEELCGVGVAYQLVRALVKTCGRPPGLRNKDLLGLVAIGTVADMVPLKGANRSLVYHGLKALPYNSLPGLHKLLSYAHFQIDNIDTERIGYVIGPRLNAAGRIDDASTAYRLLMTEDPWEAGQLAQKLEAQNRRRQALTTSIVEQAKERARGLDDNIKLILLSDREWPSGVIGLVAGRLVEEFGRPVLVLEEGDGESRGSARSTAHLNIVEALTEVKDLLVRFGGHAAAAGFTVKNDQVEALNSRLCELAGARLESHQLQPTYMADAEITMADVTDDTLDSISRLAPFGSGNPLPVFMARGVHAREAQTVGDGSHLKLHLTDAPPTSGRPIEAIAFGFGRLAELIRRRPVVDLLFTIERREWRGEKHLQLRVKDIRISES